MLQLPWSAPSGLFLVVDMWSGISGLLVYLLALGVICVSIAAENHRDVVDAAAACFPNQVRVEKVEHLRAGWFSQVLQRRRFDGGDPRRRLSLPAFFIS